MAIAKRSLSTLLLFGLVYCGFAVPLFLRAASGQLAACELDPALEISLFAREPYLVDPVALTWDEEGRLYVVEMRDYPYGIGPERKPGGTIRLLEDTDDDGSIDRSLLFADGLSFPTSIAPWNGGILVTAPPEILFLKDTDGDGKADLREVVLSGFTLGVTDSNLNGLRWGLDNRVHGVNGGNDGKVVSARKPGVPVDIRNLDFSFDPATGDFTTTYHTSGGFGLVFDEWGRSFVTYNVNHIQQRMIPVRYLQRFPGLPPIQLTESISDHDEMSRIYPISLPETRVNHPEQSGHFSAAGGMGYIGSTAYSEDLFGSILVCDVVGNLVHRDLLSPRGPGFVASRSRAEQTREVFASRDPAFRPVGVELGPDGALYLIDMQRDVIEHPDYIPQRVLEKLDIRAGENRGRIYRITPKGGLPSVKPNLRRASAAELVAQLSNENPWWRFAAQRLLVERQDKSALSALKKLAAEASSKSQGRKGTGSLVAHDTRALSRVHALWTLQGLKALDEPFVAAALSDSHPGVRENALVLAEPYLRTSSALRRQILKLSADADPRVRFQAALTMGEFDRPNNQDALLRILRSDYAWRWSRVAVFSSIRDGEEKFIRALLDDRRFLQNVTTNELALVTELADLVGARAAMPKRITAVISALNEGKLDPRWQVAVLDGLHTGLSRSGRNIRADSSMSVALERLSSRASPALLAAAWSISRDVALPETDAQRSALAQAATRAQDTSRPTESRLQELQLLRLGTFSVVGPPLLSLLEGAQPFAIQAATLEALRQFNDPALAEGLVQRWRGLAPAIRPAVVSLLLQRISFHIALLTAIENGQIKLGELNLDLEQRRRLLRQSTPEIRSRAAKWIGDEEYSNRKTLVDDWLKKLPRIGDPARGRATFEKVCSQCHALEGIGYHVGPDLLAVAHRSVEDLLSNILDPNMAINPAYVSYNVETVSGEIENGILVSESSDAITLLQAQGRKTIVPRKQIKRLESSGLSLMPEGLEASLTPAGLRDLIAFLQEKR